MSTLLLGKESTRYANKNKKEKDGSPEFCALNPYRQPPPLMANCPSFDLNVSRGSPNVGESTKDTYSDSDISNLIGLFEQQMSATKNKRASSNVEYKRRLVHLALYRSSLPKFNDTLSGDASCSIGTGKSSGERSLQPKSVWSEDTPKLANLSNELGQAHAQTQKEKLKPNISRMKHKSNRGKADRVRYCMAKKSTTLKFLKRLAANHFDTKEYSSALEVFEEILRIYLSQLQVVERQSDVLNADTETLANAYYNVAICHFYLRGEFFAFVNKGLLIY